METEWVASSLADRRLGAHLCQRPPQEQERKHAQGCFPRCMLTRQSPALLLRDSRGMFVRELETPLDRGLGDLEPPERSTRSWVPGWGLELQGLSSWVFTLSPGWS